METFSGLLAICAGNTPVTGEFHAERPVTRSFDVFLNLSPLLSIQWWGWWFKTPSRPLWRHCNESAGCKYTPTTHHYKHRSRKMMTSRPITLTIFSLTGTLGFCVIPYCFVRMFQRYMSFLCNPEDYMGILEIMIQQNPSRQNLVDILKWNKLNNAVRENMVFLKTCSVCIFLYINIYIYIQT